MDRNEYNHITATYFLLAERKLRMQRSDQHAKKGKGGSGKAKATLEAMASLKSEAAAAGGATADKQGDKKSGCVELGALKEMTEEAGRETSSPPLPPIQMASSMPAPT